MSGKGLLLDLRPLRESPEFRRLWAGLGLSSIGNQITVFALTLQIHEQTHSAFAVGAIGLFTGVPALFVALFGGSLADAMDRRKLVLVTTSLQAAIACILSVQALLGLHQLWLLYTLVAAQFLLGSINVPAIRTFLPRLLPKEQIPSGAALRMLTMHVSLIGGPVIAGLLAALLGLTALYAIDALSFAAALYALARLRPMLPTGTPSAAGFRSVALGMRFIFGSGVVKTALLADLSLAFLGVPNALIPAINAARFGDHPATLGLLLAAPAAGGLMASMFSGPLRHVSNHVRAMLVACAAWGVTIAIFGVATSLALALTTMLVAGGLDTLIVVLRMTVIQTATPDAYMGRVAAAEYVVGNAGPQLGNFRAGVIATLTSSGTSAVIGGLTTVVCIGLLALWAPYARTRANADGKENVDLPT